MLTPDQLDKRKLGIGGSDAAAVAGKCPWRTPLELYLDKVENYSIDSDDEEERFYWGNELEPVILKAYERKMGEKCLPFDENTKEFFKEHHKIYTWMRANIDGYILNKNIVVECKTANHHTMHLWGEAGTSQIPINYLYQCAHYAIVYDATRVDLAVLFGANDFRIYHYERDEEFEQELIETERNFWHEHVLKEIPPKPISLNDAAILWPKSFEKNKIVTPETFVNILKRTSIKSCINKLEAEEEELKLKIQQELEDNEALMDANGNRLITWKNQDTTRFCVTKFKQDYPNLYAQYSEIITTRVFRDVKIKI
jgi:putative phage-type endonuclease